MSLFITVSIAIIVMVVFRFRNVKLYRENYTGIGSLGVNVVRSYNALNAPPSQKLLEVSYNFFDFTANLIFKLAHFIIFAVITYIFRDIAIIKTIFLVIYSVFIALAWMTYKARTDYYKNIPPNERDFFTPIYKASICIPVYQIIIAVLLAVIV